MENTTYTVTATNEYGCTAPASVQVNIRRFEAVSEIQPATCHGGHDGAINVEVSGGVAPYFYQWSNGATTPYLSQLAAGTYYVTVTDDTGCKGIDSFHVTQPAPMLVSATSVTSVPCDQACNGSITVQTEGGTAPYNYAWLHGATGSTVSSLCAGIYTVNVTDDHGCQATGTFNVADTSNYHLSYEITPVTCNGNCDAAITLIPDFGGSSYQVVWNQNPAQTGDQLQNLCGGSYQAAIAVGSSCNYSLYFQIDEAEALEFLHVYATQPDCYGDVNGSLNIDVTGGTLPYTYTVNGAAASQWQTGLAPGTYQITVTDAGSCHIDTTVQITQPAPLALSISTTAPPCPEVCSGAIELTVSGGSYPFRYNWSNGGDTQDATNLCAGDYTVTVTDMHNCTATISATLTDSSHFPTAIMAWSDADTLYAGQSTTFHATDLGSGFVYQWLPETGLETPNQPTTIVNAVTTTDYVVHVIDDAGCEQTDTIHLLVREVICDEPYVFVPNAFTPNGDGKNDVLYVRSDIVLEVNFQVFDRWGEKVFETDDLQTGWDGTFRGSPCEPGIYDYYLKVVCFGQIETLKKGNVTLIR